MPRIVDITGQRFGRLVALHMDGLDTGGRALWVCACDCGKTKTLRGSRLRYGSVASCGCLTRERVAAMGRAATGEKSPAWKGSSASYFAMHQRVYAARGRPQQCEQCGTTDPKRTYDWASLTHNYADVNDYRRMCRPCHRKYDGVKPPPRAKR